MKKGITLFLVLCFLIGCFAACGGNEETPAQTTASQQQETTLAQKLGFGEEDNGDETFRILVNNENEHFDMKSDFEGVQNGNVVEVATYNRITSCNDYLGIDIELKPMAGAYNSNVIKTLEKAGVSDYHMVAIGLNTGIMSQQIGLFENVLEMKYINASHDWWVQDVIDQVSMNGQLYFLSGDFATSTYGYLGCIFANLQVDADYGLDTDYYGLVNQGNWTLDTFFSLYKDVGTGEEAYNSVEKTGKLGWANVSTGTRVMWSSCGISLFDRDEATEVISLKKSLDETTINFMTKLKGEFDKDNTKYFGDAEKADADVLFENNRCLFYSYYVFKAKEFNSNGMTAEFAILPLPKLNSEQSDYISTNVSAYNALFFLRVTENLDLSGKVAEYMGWYGKTNIIPAYYDNYLKLRASNKMENVAMLDMIREKLTISANELFGTIENVIGRTVLNESNVLGKENYTPIYTQPAQWAAMNGKAISAINEYVILYYGRES